MPTVLDDISYGGFFKSFADEFQLSPLSAGLGESYEIGRIGFKPYACCRSNHSTLDAIRSIFAENPEVRSDHIEAIRIECSTLTREYGWITEVDSVGAAQASVPFCAAVMCLEGNAFIEQFTEEKIKDERIHRFMQKVEMVPNPEWDRLGPTHRWRVEVSIRLSNGNRFQKMVEHPRGTIENPLPEPALKEKFMLLASRVISTERADKLAALIDQMEHLDDVQSVLDLLS